MVEKDYKLYSSFLDFWFCFGEHNIVGCVAPNGEKYVFDKNFLIDPDKPDEIYADITITKG